MKILTVGTGVNPLPLVKPIGVLRLPPGVSKYTGGFFYALT
jgi:hypothetical protein